MKLRDRFDRWAYKTGRRSTIPPVLRRQLHGPTGVPHDKLPVVGGGNPVGGEGGSGDPLPAICIKDFPSAARFTARQVAISQVDDQWFTYNRAERRRLARLSRHHGRGYTR